MNLRLYAAVVTVLVWPISSPGQASSDLWQEVREAFNSGNRFAVPSLIVDPAGDAETVSRYLTVEQGLYWEARDLPAVIFVSEQGIGWCLTRAGLEAENPLIAGRLRAAAGRIAFNLASRTWPGWDEAEIVITDEQRAIGAAAARFALMTSEELESGPAALANGNWMVGAHELANGQVREAARSFERAALFARAAGDRGMELTSEGFAVLAEIVNDPGARGPADRLAEIRNLIGSEVENPEFWTTQFDSAYRVFVR